MTEQNQEPTRFDELDKLTQMLEQTQVRHAQELNKLQQEYKDLVDRSEYKAKKREITELHEQISKTLSKTIEETRESTRKQLAESLLRPDSNHPEDVRHYRAMVDLVEQAGQDTKKIDELVHRALKYRDRTLARLLIRAHCGTKDKRTMHMALSNLDPTIKQLYDFESSWGSYNKQDSPRTWTGWVTYDANTRFPDIPGRPDHLQPRALHEAKQARINKLRNPQQN